MTKSADSPARPHNLRHPSRRTLLRVSANAAWAVPTIAMVTSAPAMAASGPALITTTFTKPVRSAAALPIVASFANANTGATTGLSVSLALTVTGIASLSGTTSTTPAGFAAPTMTTTNLTQTVTFTYLPTAQIAGRGSLAFTPTITLGGAGRVAGTAVITPVVGSPGTATGASQTYS